MIFKKNKDASPPGRRRSARKTELESEPSSQRLFQRGRTLTGSLSSGVASANEQSGNLRSPRAHVHHLSGVRHKLGVTLLAVLFMGIATLYIMSEFTASVDVSSSRSGEFTDQQKAAFSEVIDEYYAKYPADRFRFSLDEDRLLGYVQSKLPEAESLSVAGAGIGAHSNITIKPRQSVASWVVNGRVMYVDANGVAYDTDYSDSTRLVKIIDDSGIPVVDGKALTSQRFLSFVGQFVGAAKQHGLTVTEATLPRYTTKQIEFSIKDIGYKVKVSVDRSAGEQAEDMARSIRYISNSGQSVKYLDVRVKGRAYYK